MRNRRGVVGVLVVAVLAGLLGLVPGAAQAAREADLIVSQKNDVDTFDPTMSTNTSTHNITINIFDTLVRLADNGRDFVPELAESWRVVDATTWQFKLRRGVKFHNGEDFNAEAVKFTLDGVQDAGSASRYSGPRTVGSGTWKISSRGSAASRSMFLSTSTALTPP